MWMMVLVSVSMLQVVPVPGTYPSRAACELDAARVRAEARQWSSATVLCTPLDGAEAER